MLSQRRLVAILSPEFGALVQTDLARNEPALGRRKQKPRPKRQVPRLPEATVPPPLREGWRQLYGGLPQSGVSIEAHDFELPQPFEWSRTFQPDSLELCLNLAGRGSILCAGAALAFEPLTAGFYLPGRQVRQAVRDPGQRHRFVTFKYSPRFLRGQLASCDGALHPLVEAFMRGQTLRARFGELRQLTAAQEQRACQWLAPPVLQGARQLWFRAQALEVMAEFFFERRGEDELFCDRQKRLARERAGRVAALLQKHLVEPLSLEAIGREVGCSPFHLSRTFSREMGMSIPQYLRKLRMERAAELLRSGKYNVTEAALEVGYSSLSHFSQAFCQTMGCCPGLYPLKTPTQTLAERAGLRASPAGQLTAKKSPPAASAKI
jgi:AraC-like DNA-binding protein